MIALCRVILNLRQSDPAMSSSTTESQARSVRFIGNVGESLQFSEEETEEDVVLDPPPPVDVSITPGAVLDKGTQTSTGPPV